MSLFAGAAESKLRLLRAELEPLAARYDVVVANPPYMGSSSLNRWEAAWAKRRYHEGYRDLCTCFIERGFSLCGDHGSNAMITMQSWMFLGSYERMREKLLRERSISSMAHVTAIGCDEGGWRHVPGLGVVDTGSYDSWLGFLGGGRGADGVMLVTSDAHGGSGARCPRPSRARRGSDAPCASSAAACARRGRGGPGGVWRGPGESQ